MFRDGASAGCGEDPLLASRRKRSPAAWSRSGARHWRRRKAGPFRPFRQATRPVVSMSGLDVITGPPQENSFSMEQNRAGRVCFRVPGRRAARSQTGRDMPTEDDKRTPRGGDDGAQIDEKNLRKIFEEEFERRSCLRICARPVARPTASRSGPPGRSKGGPPNTLHRRFGGKRTDDRTPIPAQAIARK